MALVDDALDLAAEGWPVFPCKDKRPLCKGGFLSASTDPDTVRALFAAAPDATQIGLRTGACSFDVADVDPRHGGLNWDGFLTLPTTHTTETPSAGFHFRMQHVEGVRNSTGLIAPGVDVRGDGGYVIAAPSPGYRVTAYAPIAPWPDYLLDIILKRKEEPEAEYIPRPRGNGTVPPSVTHARVAGLIRGTLRAMANAAPGSRHAKRFNVGRSIAGYAWQSGLSDEQMEELIYYARPPEDEEARERKAIRDGIANGRANPRDINDLPDDPDYKGNGEDFVSGLGMFRHRQQDRAEGPKQDDAGQQTENTSPLIYFEDVVVRSHTADFVENLLIDNAMSVVYGESNSGKTFVALDLALHVASGRTWRGQEVRQGGVVYCALEGSYGITNRVVAWKLTNPGVHAHLALLPVTMNLLDPKADTPDLIERIKEASEHMAIPVRWVIIDTLARAMAGGNENASEAMGALVMNTDKIRAQTTAHVTFIHHSGKDTAKGARGHSSLRAATDTEIEVLDEEEGGRSVRVTKQRELEYIPSFAFSLKTVQLAINDRGKPVTSCVVKYDVDGEEEGAKPAARRGPKLKGYNLRAFDILTNALAGHGLAGFANVPTGFLSIPEEWWRDRFYEQALPGATQTVKQRAFRRAADALVELHVVGMAGGRVWRVYPESSS